MSLPRIAVDAMGGDEGVRVMVSGAALARRRHERFKFLLVGDEVTFVPGHGQPSTFGRERQSNPFVSDAAIAAGR